MEKSTSSSPNESLQQLVTASGKALKNIREAKSFNELMKFLERGNLAAIVEAIRKGDFLEELFVLYKNHPHSVVRHELACHPHTPKEKLKIFFKDDQISVRTAARRNFYRMDAPSVEIKAKEKTPEKEPAQTEASSKETSSKKNENKLSKKQDKTNKKRRKK